MDLGIQGDGRRRQNVAFCFSTRFAYNPADVYPLATFSRNLYDLSMSGSPDCPNNESATARCAGDGGSLHSSNRHDGGTAFNTIGRSLAPRCLFICYSYLKIKCL